MTKDDRLWQPPPAALGVLGGMGPAATVDFLQRVVTVTSAGRDQEHVPVIVYSDPTTPDRSDAILGVGPDPLPALLHGIRFLARSGCPLIAIPCNTAHHWHRQLQEATPSEVLHIGDTAIAAIDEHAEADRIRTVGVLATDGTVRTRIYHGRVESSGRAAIDLAHDRDNPTMASIRALKAGDLRAAERLFLTAAERLVERGADALVVGCTDLSVVASAVSGGPAPLSGTPILDASTTLARSAVARMRAT